MSSDILSSIEKKLDFLIKCRSDDKKTLEDLKQAQAQTNVHLASIEERFQSIKEDVETIKTHLGVTTKARTKASLLQKLDSNYIAKCDAKLKKNDMETKVMLITKFKSVGTHSFRALFDDDVFFKYSGVKQIPKGRIDIMTCPTFKLLADTWKLDLQTFCLSYNEFGRKNRNRISQMNWYHRKRKINQEQGLVEYHHENIVYLPEDEAAAGPSSDQIVMEETKEEEEEDQLNGYSQSADDDDDDFIISYDGCWKSTPEDN